MAINTITPHIFPSVCLGTEQDFSLKSFRPNVFGMLASNSDILLSNFWYKMIHIIVLAWFITRITIVSINFISLIFHQIYYT